MEHRNTVIEHNHSNMMQVANGISNDRQLSGDDMQRAYKLLEASLTRELTAYIVYNIGGDKIVTYTTIMDKLSRGSANSLNDNEIQVVKSFL